MKLAKVIIVADVILMIVVLITLLIPHNDAPDNSTELLSELTTEAITELTTEATTEPTTEVTTEKTTEATAAVVDVSANVVAGITISNDLFRILDDFVNGSGRGFAVTTPEEFKDNVYRLKTVFPDSYYWNKVNANTSRGYFINGKVFPEYFRITQNQCYRHSRTSAVDCNVYSGVSDSAYPYKMLTCQCWGFASLVSDIMFGKNAPVKKYTSYDEVRVGDQIRCNNEWHTVLVLDVTPEYVEVVECNADYYTCLIKWGRRIPRSELAGAWYISRWGN